MAETDPAVPSRPDPVAPDASAAGRGSPDPGSQPDSLQGANDTHFIVQSAQRNDRHAWTLLSAKVLFFLRSRFGRVNLPTELEFDDFGSEVMLRILADIHRFTDTGKGAFWGWVYILAQNRLNDLWRMHQRRHRMGLLARGDGDDGDETRDGGEHSAGGFDQMSNPKQQSPSDDAHVRDLENIERDCAARLPESMCRIYLMRREQELSFEEISTAFGGVKPVTLRSYYKRSRDFVKDCIQRKVDNLGSTFGAWLGQ